MRIGVKRRGFTLVELLATIVIVGLLFGLGYSIFSGVISTSRSKSMALSNNSLRSSARLYTKEYAADVNWNNKTACVPVSTLVSFGYIKENQVRDYINSYVYVIKDDNGNIVSEKLDEEGELCGGNAGKLKYINSYTFCNNLTYSDKPRNSDDFCQKDEDGNCPVQIVEMKHKGSIVGTIGDAGLYVLTVKDIETSQTKDIQCRVKKAIPSLDIDPPGSSSAKIGEINYSVISSDVDGKVSVKSSNKAYVTGEIVDYSIVPKSNDDKSLVEENGDTDQVENTQTEENIEEEESSEVEEVINYAYKWGLRVKTLAGKDAVTYLTVTLKPNDTTNYSNVNFSYTVSKSGKVDALVPTEEYCRDVMNTGKEQVLVNMPEPSEGFTFLNYKASELGGHEVIARLKYGYVWGNNGKDEEDNVIEVKGTTKDYKLKCYIREPGPPKVYVKYHMNGGTWGGSTSTSISYKGDYATCNGSEICETYYPDADIDLANWDNPGYINFKKDHSHAKEGEEWNTKADGSGRSFPDTGMITAGDLCDTSKGRSCTVTLYVNWVNDDCRYKFNGNGNTGGSMPDKLCGIGEKCVLPANAFIRTNYGFKKWTVNSDGSGTSYTNGANITSICNGTQNLYAQWDNSTYKIKFNCDGSGSMGEVTCVVGNDCKLPSSSSCTKTGHSFVNWKNLANGNTYSNGAVVRDLAPAKGEVTLTAQWVANVCTITFAPNGGKFGKNANDTVRKLSYNNTVSNFWNATGASGTFNASRTGYHVDGAAAWIRTSDSKTFNQGSSYTALNVCPNLASKNESVTLKVNWKINVCTITYDPGHKNAKFKKNAKNVTQTLNYGSKISNMRNTTGSGGYYNAVYSGYTVTGAKAWISSIGKKKYDQGKGYKATNFCPDLAKGNQKVTLYVNWWRYLYNRCTAGYSCAAAGCASPCTKQVHAGTYNTLGHCQSTCNGYSNGKCKSWGYGYACYLTTSCGCNAYYSSASACGCKKWSGWGTTSCSGGSNTCQRTQQFVRAQ